MNNQQREVLMLLMVQHGRNPFHTKEFVRVRDMVERNAELGLGLQLITFTDRGYIHYGRFTDLTITDKAIQELQHDRTTA
jgi:hypothetical protein